MQDQNSGGGGTTGTRSHASVHAFAAPEFQCCVLSSEIKTGAPKARPWSVADPKAAARVLRSGAFGHDLDLHVGGHVAVNFHPDRVFAKRLDGVAQDDLALVDLETLGRERLRDVG